jgi:hypothetical protein
MAAFQCHVCGTPVRYDEPIPRDAECEGCRTDVRSCVNCRHYDVRMNNQCRETQADPVVDKKRRNFCEYFYFSREPFVAGGSGASKESEARAKLEAMFGGGSKTSGTAEEKLGRMLGEQRERDREAEAREKLRKMFGEGKS